MLMRAIKSLWTIRSPRRKSTGTPSEVSSCPLGGTSRQPTGSTTKPTTTDCIADHTEKIYTADEEHSAIHPHIDTTQRPTPISEPHDPLEQTILELGRTQNNLLGFPDRTTVHLPTTIIELHTIDNPSSGEKNLLIEQVELLPSPFAPSFVPSTNNDSVSEIYLPESGPFSQTLATLEPLSADHEIEIMQRKIWVRRPGASATLVAIHNDDLVDTVRDVILLKYANSLGRSIDSPDITLKICSREQTNKNIPVERILGPEEHIGKVLDLYYAGGQTIEEALIIEVPQKRTPKPSPKVGNHLHGVPFHQFYMESQRPTEAAPEYFPPMAVHSPHPSQHQMQLNGPPPVPHSMASVFATGHPPPLPSPGAHSTRKHRPKYIRQHTSSPTILHHQPTSADLNKPTMNGIAPPAPLPTPPAQPDHRPSVTPPNRSSPPPHAGRYKRKKQIQSQSQSQNQNAKSINGEPPQPQKLATGGLLDGNVPPINVLIVEDNVINLRLLEQFMRRLKVRWKTAMNGREAVNTWRTGGFHLVLMDIQLPIMSGLEATKEIRRLESVNGIGLGLVGGQNAYGGQNGDSEINAQDKLPDMSLFKSPVIIVALTASSLQSDRHEALAVGCNDFLTKPVGYPWMLRKVTEWGCMQALIDFDGFRKWKEMTAKKDEGLTEEQKKAKEKEERMKQKAALKAMFSKPPPGSSGNSNTSTTAARESPAQNDGAGAKSEQSAKPLVNGNSAVGGSSRHKNARGGSISVSPVMLPTHQEEADESS